MTQQRLIMAVFFLQALTFGSWLPRIPQVQESIGLDHGTLALGLIGFPIGTLAMLPFAGRLTAALGSRFVIFYGFIGFLIAITLPGWAFSLTSLFFALVVAGTSMSLLELGLNVKADEIERLGGRMIMNTCHGFWSLGVMVGSLAAAGFVAVGLAPGPSQVLFAAAILPVCLWASRLLSDERIPEAEPDPSLPKGRIAAPHPILIGIAFFVLGTTLTEGAAADWSAVFLRDEYGVSPAFAGFGYTTFALMLTFGRFSGDWMKARFGAAALARTCALLGVAGGLVLFFSQSALMAIGGFALLGFGASVGFPLAVTAAAEAPGKSASGNVAVLTFFALTGFLAGPPVIGFLADAFGLRWGLAILIPALSGSAVLAMLLRRHSAPRAAAAPAAS